MTQKLKNGQIWTANLNPNKGLEPGKTRPVLILQDQALLDIEHPSTLIVPLTTKLIDDAAPLRIRIHAQDKLKKDSDLLIDQLRSIDNLRLVNGPLLTLDKDLMKDIYSSVCLVIGCDTDSVQS